MQNAYHHLTRDQRCQIYALKKRGMAQAKIAMDIGVNQGTISREHFELLAIAINTGTNLPSVATPNGQAAFLFLLTSALAPLIRLSYGTMLYMALPYTFVLSIVGMIAISVAF